MTVRLAWFSTGRGPGSRNLLTAVAEAIASGDLDAEIAVVFVNRAAGEHEGTDAYLRLAEAYRLPLVTLSSARFRREQGGGLSRPGEPLPAWRHAYDAAVAGLLAPFRFDYGVLAGYMLICTEELCNRFRLLNLHPAAPGGPVGTWQEVIRQLIREHADGSGVTIHLVTPELDRGPVLSYCTYRIDGPEMERHWQEVEPGWRDDQIDESELFRAIRERGARREMPLVIETIRALSRLSVTIAARDGASGRATLPAVDLTEEVESSLSQIRS